MNNKERFALAAILTFMAAFFIRMSVLNFDVIDAVFGLTMHIHHNLWGIVIAGGAGVLYAADKKHRNITSILLGFGIGLAVEGLLFNGLVFISAFP